MANVKACTMIFSFLHYSKAIFLLLGVLNILVSKLNIEKGLKDIVTLSPKIFVGMGIRCMVKLI